MTTRTSQAFMHAPARVFTRFLIATALLLPGGADGPPIGGASSAFAGLRTSAMT